MRRIIEKRVYWMLVVIVALIFGLGWGRVDVDSVQGQPVVGSLGTNGLITHFYDDPSGGPTRVIVIDPLQKRMAVYHVPIANGEIQIKSVRNLSADLLIQAYNSEEVSPVDTQKMLDRN